MKFLMRYQVGIGLVFEMEYDIKVTMFLILNQLHKMSKTRLYLYVDLSEQ